MSEKPPMLFITAHRVQGAITLLSRLKEMQVQLFKGKDGKVYSDAIYTCLLEADNMDRYLHGVGSLRFTDFEKDKKGKLVKCKAVVVE